MSSETMSVCAEISYATKDGGIHSDVCPEGHLLENVDGEHRELLHACLDEWLNQSNGTGYFFMGNSNYYRFIPDADIIPALSELIN